jgi:multidrug efflux pump subunit AcrB
MTTTSVRSHSTDPLFFSTAVILAFGLVLGTVLTLGIVPVIYSVLFRIRQAR